MQSIFVSFLLACACNAAHAQEELLLDYRYQDSMTTRFINVVSDQDTLIVYGLARNEYGQQGLVFLKVDTFGNVLASEHHVDSINPPFFASQSNDIVLTDLGYQFIGDDTQGGIIYSLNFTGQTEHIYRLPEDPFPFKSHTNMVSLSDSYLVGGRSQVEASRIEIFVLWVDTTGTIQREYEYGDMVNYFSQAELVTQEDTAVIVAAYISESLGELGWEQPWIFCIDTLGEIQWEWFGERDIKGGVVDDLVLTPDGGYVFLNTFVDSVIPGVIDRGLKRGRLVKLDSARNVEWSSVVGQPTLEFNELTELLVTPSGDFLAAGRYIPVEINGTGDAMVNWMVKFSEEGEVLWERFDSTIYTPEGGVWNDPSGMTMLSSGSIIISGSMFHIKGTDQQERGYLIKLDKNGCAVPGCELGPLTRLEVPYQAMPEVRVFPNPASGSVTIEISSVADILMFDTRGQYVLARDDVMDSTHLDLTQVPAGIYFLRIATKGGWTVRKVVIE